MPTGNPGIAHTMPLVEVRLNCAHSLLFREDSVPDPGGEVWCARCQGYKHRPFPLKTGSDGMPVLREWQWKCATRDQCNCGPKKYGQDRMRAYAGARRHSVNNAGHEVWMISPIGCVTDRWSVGAALFETDEEVFKDASSADRQARTPARAERQ